jgi:hypothetical protein
MSRVFTVNFPFKGRTYTVLVSFNCYATENSYLVKYLDQEAALLIPGSRLVVSVSGKVEYPKPLENFSKDLVSKTTQAIKGYLELHQN